jgi:membrane-associated protease RseP (regulator of RpoE activity)
MSTNISTILPEADVSVTSNIEIGDKILKIGEKKIRIKNDLSKALEGFEGGTIDVVIERNGEEKTFTVKPIKYMDQAYILGIQVALASDSSIQERMYYSF